MRFRVRELYKAVGSCGLISHGDRNGATKAALMSENELATQALDICFLIHRKYGPGLFESVYEEIFCYEWAKTKIPYLRQHAIPVIHEEIKMEVGFRADVILDNK